MSGYREKAIPPKGEEGMQPLAFGSLGSEDVQALTRRLSGGSPSDKVSCASALGEYARGINLPRGKEVDGFGHLTLKPPVDLSDSYRSLLEAAGDDNPFVRAEAVWAIGEHRSERGLDALRRVLESDPDPSVRQVAVYSSGKICTDKAVQLLRIAAQDRDPQVKASSIDVLGNVMRSIFGGLISPDMADRVDALGNLLHYGKEMTQESLDSGGRILAETAQEVDGFGHIRFNAVLSLSERGNEKALAELKEEIKRGGPIKIDLGELPLGARSVEVGADYVKVTGVDGKVSTHAESEMGSVLKDLSKGLGGFVSPQELQEMVDVGALMELDGKITRVHNIVARTVRRWNERFDRSIDLPPTKRKLLCAFTSNVDALCFLKDNVSAQKKIDTALKDAIEEGKQLGKSPQDVTDEIEWIIRADPDKASTTAEKEETKKRLALPITTKAQAIGFILRVFPTSGGKQSIDDRLDERGERIPTSGKALADWVRDTFKPEARKLGGASAQMADFLAGIGEENVAVYTQYHSQMQANAYERGTRFMRIVDDKPVAHAVDDPHSIVPNSPTKENYPVEVMPGVEVKFNGKTLKARDLQDRVIFTTEYYDEQGRAYDFIPLFEFTDDILRQIGRDYQYFIINGPHYLQRFDPKKYEEIAPKMRHQLEKLREEGVKTHFEFSGNTSQVRYLYDVIQGNIASMGINHTEVAPLASSMQKGFDESMMVTDGRDMYSTYLNALEIAKSLGLERLYVHGHNIDFTLRRNPAEGDLEAEQRANLHAKQRVTEWLKGEESSYPTSPSKKPMPLLKREGYEEMIRFAEKMAEDLGLHGLENLKFVRDSMEDGRADAKYGYTVVFMPVKWIYGETKVTTSSGDITSSSAYIQSPI